MKNQFLTSSAATDFEPASIAQLVQVESFPVRYAHLLLFENVHRTFSKHPHPRWQSLAQIQGAFLSNSRFFMVFVYTFSLAR
jgi:hypothetical protein